ncbi:peptidase domain-containing ABC transporter [Cohaesibacter haloalkalitolerans]|uniref:peptidase domain-containing ABC transporter n=1 Tax=Cohaesibacter haloalkalitolerans TaxID=1162980 RepID=UPI000E65EA65|nr:ABC transporter transmembrane domain-containing protein [Cohaesibacter haloalkalitolerans]
MIDKTSGPDLPPSATTGVSDTSRKIAFRPIRPAERSNKGKKRSNPVLLRQPSGRPLEGASFAEAARQLDEGDVALSDLAQYSNDHHLAGDPPLQADALDEEDPFAGDAVLLSPEAELEPVPFSDLEERLGISERWSGIDYHSSAGRCVQVLLALIGWAGGGRHLAQVLPHFNTVNDMTGLRAVLTRLNYVAIADEARLEQLSNEKMPCLYEDEDGLVRIVLAVDYATRRLSCFNGLTGQEEEIACPGRPVLVYYIKPIDVASQNRFVQSFGWVTHAAASFRKLFLSLFVINFGINIAAMAVPIFIMTVYGYAIPSKAPGSLMMFVIGVGLVIAADHALRALRTRILAYVGARFDTALSVEVFQRLLYLPYTMVQNASMGAQLARLRQFEKLREIFLGSFGTAVLDLPFVLVFITAITLIGGWIAAIPSMLVVCYIVLALVTVPIAKRQTMQSGDAKSRKQNIMMELFLMHREIKSVGGEAIWQKRYEEASANFAALDFRAQHFSRQVQTISQALSMAAGIATLGAGTIMVMEGNLGVGGLIAIMALIWRVLAPLQNAFLSLSRIGKLIEAVRMVNNLMRTQTERMPGVVPSISRKFKGHISTKNLSFRYPQAADAAIKSANVVINPGEIVAITGPSGGGKSTFLKLLAGIYRPVAGAVGFDHLDIRQMDLGELRFEISYQPDNATFFYGTVAQNFHLNDPETNCSKMLDLMAQFNIEADDPNLPEGLDTRLKAETIHQMPDALKQKLLLCRSFSKAATYYFLDEPANYLDFETDRKFMDHLETMRGTSTILFTTQRPSHMKMADRILLLHEGQVILNGPPEKVLPQLDAFNKSVA